MPRARPISCCCLLAAFLMMGLVRGFAQEPGSLYTLHVYTNLIQIPTLVLSTSQQPLPPIALERFRVRIDGSKPFVPKHVRVEGEDPISLVVLADLGGGQNKLLERFPGAFAGLVPGSLHAQDQIGLFAIDCNLVRHNAILGAASPTLEAAVERTLSAPTVHGSRTRSACGRNIHLYDALAYILQSMKELPGRRVLLAITDGYDGGSHFRAEQIRHLASEFGVALFAINGDGLKSELSPSAQYFTEVCERTGGLLIRTDPGDVKTPLKNLIQMLRGRYIIEFQRQGDMTSGSHSINVEVPHLSAFIRAAGTSAPIADPRSETDVQREPATAPAQP